MRIAFISTNPAWGGSEELWSRTALELAREGLSVGASICYPPTHRRILQLAESQADIQVRQLQHSVLRRAWWKVFANGKSPAEVGLTKFLDARSPDLVVVSNGAAFQATELLELCLAKKLPFVTICQNNTETFWPDDDLASRHRLILTAASRCYFVSKANQRLCEKQIGCELPNAEIVHNPFNVDINASLRWPELNDAGALKLACVAALLPDRKGQDILLEALAAPGWSDRNWRLSLYGEGDKRNVIERMVQRFGLKDRVQFAGYTPSVEKIWAENHVLVLPSRYEGMPLALVEAMLCSRPAVVTNVGGNAEIIDDGVTGFVADGPTTPSLQAALEGLWSRRTDLEQIGRAAGKSVRERIPADPIRIFAEKIKMLARQNEAAKQSPP